MSQNIFQKAYHNDLNKVYSRFDGVIFDNVIGDIPDLQAYFEKVWKEIGPDTKILISYHNPSWEPMLNLASKLGLRKKVGVQNWLTQEDLKNILNISGFEVISAQKRFWGITTITIARPRLDYGLRIRDYRIGAGNYNLKSKINNLYSVSIIVPARNEEGNIAKIIPSIPKFGKSQEIIFVEGNSQDKTWERIKIEELRFKNAAKHKSSIINHKSLIVRAYKQTGKGKADAVRMGFEKATGEILMIYDADRTVPASELPKFYNVLASGLGEFINGSRLVYPMEAQAMQTLNKMGNQFFSSVFTKIFGQHFKDTLCGTKALQRRDFEKMKKDYLHYLKKDPFGDFALIFAAIRHNLKVVEVPVHYKERTYGRTNIKRFRHGILLFKLAWIALREFKL